MTTSDMPMDSSFEPLVEKVVDKKPTKQKITARGQQSTTAKSTTKTTPKTTNISKKSKAREDLVDLEQMNQENINSYRFKSRRNRVLIVTLVILLVTAIAVISIFLAVSKLQTNCNFYAHGADASFIIDGEKLSQFRTPANIQGNSRLEMEIELQIKDSGMFNIKFVALCYQKGQLMNNTLIYTPTMELFKEGALVYDENDPYYYSKQPIHGNQTIRLCGGVILDYEYRDSLNVDNFKLEFHVYLEKV